MGRGSHKHATIGQALKALETLENTDLRFIMEKFIKSAAYPFEERKAFLEYIKKMHKKPVEGSVYYGELIPAKQMQRLRHRGWRDYIPGILKLAFLQGGSYDDIYQASLEYLGEIGIEESEMTFMRTTRGKGLIKSILLLGGFELSNVKRVNGKRYRQVKTKFGEMDTSLEDRIEMALERISGVRVENYI